MIEHSYRLFETPITIAYRVLECEAMTIDIHRHHLADGASGWTVKNNLREVLSRSGEWRFESLPSNRSEDWCADVCWLSLVEATEAALAAARVAIAIHSKLAALGGDRLVRQEDGSHLG